jgi:pantoate--beta-alanine ligase
MSDFRIPIVRTRAELRARVDTWRAEGARVGLAPTMGALHEGHLSLVRLAKRDGARAIASIFVNPTQFAPHEDYHAYPRDEARDCELLASVGCDLVYAPTTQEMYPDGFGTTVTVSGVSEPLEGAFRPSHFAGVATIVAKLLVQANPDFAVFGEKDYQQLLVVRRLVEDLDLPTEIIGAPTVRLQDGLALSSRNAYLSEDERAIAGRLNVILARSANALAEGAEVGAVEAEALAALKASGFDAVDYLEVRGADDLRRLGPGPAEAPARVLAAVRIGRTRLIDNMAV